MGKTFQKIRHYSYGCIAGGLAGFTGSITYGPDFLFNHFNEQLGTGEGVGMASAFVTVLFAPYLIAGSTILGTGLGALTTGVIRTIAEKPKLEKLDDKVESGDIIKSL